jgi:hypothetical protein
VTAAPSKDGAVKFCREYAHDYTEKCIEDTMAPLRQTVLAGNCKDRSFTDFGTERFIFMGKNTDKSDDNFADYKIKRGHTGDILDGSSASGYDVELGIFRLLCPDQVK